MSPAREAAGAAARRLSRRHARPATFHSPRGGVARSVPGAPPSARVGDAAAARLDLDGCGGRRRLALGAAFMRWLGSAARRRTRASARTAPPRTMAGVEAAAAGARSAWLGAASGARRAASRRDDHARDGAHRAGLVGVRARRSASRRLALLRAASRRAPRRSNSTRAMAPRAPSSRRGSAPTSSSRSARPLAVRRVGENTWLGRRRRRRLLVISQNALRRARR